MRRPIGPCLSELSQHLRRYYARRLDSALAASGEDLVQETLMAVHTRRLTYDPTQRFTAWVFALARYKMIDLFRRQRLRITVPLEDDAALFARDEAEDTSARMDIKTVLDTIPERPRELIRQVKTRRRLDRRGRRPCRHDRNRRQGLDPSRPQGPRGTFCGRCGQ